METPRARFVIATSLLGSIACNIIDDEPGSGGDTDGSTDEQACVDQFSLLLMEGCPPGYSAQLVYDGGGSTVVNMDDPGVGVGLGIGLLVDFGATAGADWVGYKVWQNSRCTMGCFGPVCPEEQFGCYASFPGDAGLCAHYCTDALDQQACNDLAMTCLGSGGDDGLDETGTSDDGGLDETGEASGGEELQAYDCSQWQPHTVQPVGEATFLVPQPLIDELILRAGDPLVECDGVRLRPSAAGFWSISKMRETGLLGALGLRVGDELRALGGVELDSLDSLMRVLGRFLQDDGAPRRFPAHHPGFVLHARRGARDVVLDLRIGAVVAGG